LTALGLLIAALGLTEWTQLIDLFSVNLDPIWAAVNTIIGFVTVVIGFFQDRTRHEDRSTGVEVKLNNRQ
jgi:hypothetical protein